ncbi:hypothetical protein V6N11_013986 [Hibiscus sabdariffa]|uniref:Uncharacterized protein n=1 Tax=Hibiscus sabdariffa TaxID=183260 RepID=A0ABR2AGK3_9ROSI
MERPKTNEEGNITEEKLTCGGYQTPVEKTAPGGAYRGPRSVRTVNKRSSATLRTLSELEQKSFPKPTGRGALNKNNRFLCDSTLPLLVKTYQKRIRQKKRPEKVHQ